MNTSLSYSGTLILKTKTRSAVARNHGSYHLFSLLSTILCKEDFQQSSLPTYFMLYAGDVDTIISSPDTKSHIARQMLNTYVDIVSESSSSQKIFNSTFTSTIDFPMIIPDKGKTAPENLTLGLISGDKRSILAAVPFDSTVYSIVSDGGQTFVKWIMSISNSDDIIADAISNLLEG